VCPACAGRATSAAGRPLQFRNTNATGGFVARYADTMEAYPGHECFISGVRCRADEARSGGIVIEAVDPRAGPTAEDREAEHLRRENRELHGALARWRRLAAALAGALVLCPVAGVAWYGLQMHRQNQLLEHVLREEESTL